MLPKTKLRFSAWILLPVAVATFMLGAAAAEEDPSPLKEAIFKAWAERQKRTRSIKFEWKQEARLKHISLPFAHLEPPPPGLPALGEFYDVEQHVAMRLDGERFDFRFNVPDAEAYRMPDGYRTAFDGVTTKQYSGASRSDEVGTGVISGEPHTFDTDSLYSRPLILAYRPLHPTIGRLDERVHRVLPERYPLDEHSCVILQEIGDQPFLRSYWVDPANDFIVRRYQTTVEGRDRSRIDISYERHANEGWVPKTWNITRLSESGDLTESYVCTVTNYSINEPLPPDDFELTFPPGTPVINEVNQREFVVSGDEANEDGGPASASNSRTWLIFGNVVLCTLLLTLVGARYISVKRERRRRLQSK